MSNVLGHAWASTRRFRPALALVIALFIVFAATQSTFLGPRNLQNLLTAVAVLWIVSMGMTFVTIVGGIDLSAGATVAFIGIFIGKMVNYTPIPSWVVIILAILIGIAVGCFINGALIGKLGMSFFVVTLATMTALTGTVNLWSNNTTEVITDRAISWIGVERVFGMPTPIWIMIVIFLLALFVQNRTYFGRDLYAVGGSIAAAKLSGIRVERTVMAAYAIVGGCAGLASVIAVGRIGAASPQVEVDLPLQAAAAVLLGGTALAGGSGGVGGTAVGVLFIGLLQNGLSISGVQSYWQQVVTGVILVAAVLGERVTGGRVRKGRLFGELAKQRKAGL
ncbi:ABC transporter permease [Leucobacter sp. USHLN153]|uniref:ABC transporter permease n=1 Tax=Leucobacter sp. USHLN153 TaxID=3081268 RepID=UPI00301647CF